MNSTTVERIRRYRRIRSTLVVSDLNSGDWWALSDLNGSKQHHRRIRSTLVVSDLNSGDWWALSDLNTFKQHHCRAYSAVASDTFNVDGQ